MIKALSAFVATAAGKAVLGTAVAAASVGGLHAADVVDVTNPPEEEQVSTVEEIELDDQLENDAEDEAAETDDDAVGTEDVEGEDSDADGEDAAGVDEESEFSQAMEEWSACVDAASAEHDAALEEHDASESGPPEPFDPWAACPDWPHGDPPGAQDRGADAREERGERPDDAGPPSDVTGDDAATDDAAIGDAADDAAEAESEEEDVETESEEDAGPPADAGRPDDVPGGDDADADES